MIKKFLLVTLVGFFGQVSSADEHPAAELSEKLYRSVAKGNVSALPNLIKQAEPGLVPIPATRLIGTSGFGGDLQDGAIEPLKIYAENPIRFSELSGKVSRSTRWVKIPRLKVNQSLACGYQKSSVQTNCEG